MRALRMPLLQVIAHHTMKPGAEDEVLAVLPLLIEAGLLPTIRAARLSPTRALRSI